MDKQAQKYSFKELLHFLEEPDFYPHKPDKVQHIQTHISHVFIADFFVYKLKKPVNFGFLDYSKLKKRKKYCYREVELNRRLSDDIYLGVTGFARQNEKFVFEEDNPDSESIVEYAVKMRKLPDEYFLHRYIEEDSLTTEHLDRVADTLASFYLNQNKSADLSKWGEVETIKVNTNENFAQTEKFIGNTIHRRSFYAIRYFTNRYFQQNEQFFQHRTETGRIVDGHGDLHLEHIHITPDKVQIYDCIEFNERFRYGDLAADLAFLAMDLDFNGCRNEEHYFIKQMAKKLNDKELLQIIDFYKCYRAYVKGKVKSLQSAEEEVSKENRERSVKIAARYFKLSLQYALIGSKPVVIIFMGRIGTGKSTLAAYLAEQLNIEHFSSDKIRKSLAKLPLTGRTPQPRREALYAPTMSDKTYSSLITKAMEKTNQGEPVILDATFGAKRLRRKLTDCFESNRIEYIFVEVQASDKTIADRLKVREKQNNVISDARLEDFENLNANYEAPFEINDRHLIKVSTKQSKKDSIIELYRKLIDNNFLNQSNEN